MDGKAIDPLRQHILEAVDCLRQRKCRPDREAIAHYVLRKFGSTMNEIFAQLENIVDEGGLIKVEYKGTTSYRSPSSFDTKNSPLLTKHSKILNSSKTTRLIITGINELLTKDPNYSKEGVPLTELKEILKGFDAERFADDKVELLIDREINYGSIFMAKSEVLNSLRVFPKDIPVPADMKIMKIVAVSTEPAGGNDKEDKKARKPRKSSTAGTSAAGDASKKGIKVKEEAKETEENEIEEEFSDLIFAVKSEPQLSQKDPTATAATQPVVSTTKKVARLIPTSRKLVPEQIANAVRRTYEETIEFEATSARMMKLAEGLITKAVPESEESVKVKVPTLVLAESVNPSDDDKSQITLHDEPMDTSSNVETSPTCIASTGSSSSRKSGRNSGTKIKAESEELDKSISNVTSPQSSPTAEQGLTRSKRDKRKKKVFDPSDLPNNYTSFASKSSAAKRSRANRSSSSDEPPAKKTPSTKAKQTRGAQKKSLLSSKNKKTSAKSKGKNGIGANVPVLINPDEIKPEPLVKDDIKKEKDIVDDIKPRRICDRCSVENSGNQTGNTEEFLTCSSCGISTHPLCLEYSEELTQMIFKLEKGGGSRQFKWQCMNCKTCQTCKTVLRRALKSNKSNSTDTTDVKFLLCTNCDVGCHITCLEGSSTKIEPPGNTWVCKDCESGSASKGTIKAAVVKGKSKKKESTTRKPAKRTYSSKNTLPHSPEPKVAVESTDECHSSDAGDDEPGVDIRSWSLTDVESYFSSKGLKEEAAILKENEVDGTSLLLLKREDIIHGMGFRLGPALKVNRLVAELQAKAPVKAKWTNEISGSPPISQSDTSSAPST